MRIEKGTGIMLTDSEHRMVYILENPHGWRRPKDGLYHNYWTRYEIGNHYAVDAMDEYDDCYFST
jgi:hypothetical protein